MLLKASQHDLLKMMISNRSGFGNVVVIGLFAAASSSVVSGLKP